MYDDDTDDDIDDDIDAYAISDGMGVADEEIALENDGPASGGYDAFSDGEGDEDDGEAQLYQDEEQRIAKEDEEFRKHGAEERQYYDSLAKEADQKRRRMEAEIRAERLKLNDLLMKRSRLERERAGIDRELADIRANELLMAQRQYRREGLIEEDRAIRETLEASRTGGETPKFIPGALGTTPLSPIEQREITEASRVAELAIAGEKRSKEELERQRGEVERALGALSETIAERQRALSLKEHTLRRIV